MALVPLVVKDANQVPQNLAAHTDPAGNLAVWHASASLDSTGTAVVTSNARPLPVINTAGSVSVDGSGSVTSGGTAQLIFGGTTPVNGYLIANNSAGVLTHCDVGTASAAGASIPIAVGEIWITPTGYKPAGPVSLWGGTTGQVYAARRW